MVLKMNEEDKMYLNSQPDGKTVLRTRSLELRELVRKNAGSLMRILSECPDGSVMLPGPYDPGPGLINSPAGISDEASEETETRLGALIASDMTDQYRFFGYGLWGVFLEGEHIGLALLKNGPASGICEIGYAIRKEYHRKGYMTEAMLAVLEYARSCGFTKAVAVIPEHNSPSQAFMNNLKRLYHSENTYNDVDSFSLTL